MSILETNSWLFGLPSALRQQQLRNPQGLELVELVPGLLLNRSGVSMRHERGQKNRDTILTTWFVIKWSWKKLDVSSPFFWIWSKSQLDANWLCCKFLRFLLNTNLRSLWKLPNRSTGQPVNRSTGSTARWVIILDYLSWSLDLLPINYLERAFGCWSPFPLDWCILGPIWKIFLKKAISIGKSR